MGGLGRGGERRLGRWCMRGKGGERGNGRGRKGRKALNMRFVWWMVSFGNAAAGCWVFFGARQGELILFFVASAHSEIVAKLCAGWIVVDFFTDVEEGDKSTGTTGSNRTSSI